MTKTKDKAAKCGKCGTTGNPAGFEEFAGANWCERCLNEHTRFCEECDARELRYHNFGDDHTFLCESCYNNDYNTCEDCGIVIHHDSTWHVDIDGCSDDLCRDCYQIARHSAIIHDYDYKPTPVFFGNGLFMGVELEVDGGGRDNSYAEILLEIANSNAEQLYIKADGSLEDGFELVSHPMSLEHHERTMPWKDLLSEAVGMGYRSHDNDTCGLHVHVGREYLGETVEKQEEVIARIIHFFEQHWDKLSVFSRRTQAQIKRWADRYGVAGNPKAALEQIKVSGYKRNVAVNISPYSTIEFRLFRGTLRYSSFIATLQLVEVVCQTAIKLDDEQLADLT